MEDDLETLKLENERLRHAFLYTWSQLGSTQELGNAMLAKVLTGVWDKEKPVWLSQAIR